MNVSFQEAIPQHAGRLGTTENFAKQRQRILTALLKRRRLNETNLPQTALDQLFVECLGRKAGASVR